MSFTTHLMWITNRFNVIHVQISSHFRAEKVNDIDIKLIGRVVLHGSVQQTLGFIPYKCKALFRLTGRKAVAVGWVLRVLLYSTSYRALLKFRLFPAMAIAVRGLPVHHMDISYSPCTPVSTSSRKEYFPNAYC